MPQSFDFQTAKINLPKYGKPVHVAKVLVDMRDRSGISNEDREIFKHAVAYMKALERCVASTATSQKAKCVGAVVITPNGPQDIRAATAALMEAAKKRMKGGR